MIKKILTFFGIVKPSGNIIVGENSQPNRLKFQMDHAGLKHGDRVIADVNHIQLYPARGEKFQVFFCGTQSVEVKKRLEEGDGKEIPMHVTVKGLTGVNLRGTGINYYNLKNVMLYSNGTIQITGTKDTIVELVEKEPSKSLNEQFIDQYGFDVRDRYENRLLDHTYFRR